MIRIRAALDRAYERLLPDGDDEMHAVSRDYVEETLAPIDRTIYSLERELYEEHAHMIDEFFELRKLEMDRLANKKPNARATYMKEKSKLGTLQGELKKFIRDELHGSNPRSNRSR